MWETILSLSLTQGCQDLRISQCIEVKVATKTLTVFRDSKPVATFSVAVGKPSTPTPQGNYFIFERSPQASWVNPDGSTIAYNSRRSPMYPGFYLGWAKGADGIPYGIHGTNKPHTIGRAVSGGCIRVHPDHIGELYLLSPIGTPVLIR